MQKLQNIEEKELYAFLSDLRILKRKGELDTAEKLERQNVKWRNTLEYCVLESCVKHYTEECRLETLALLVESKKSTLRFTQMELHIICLFLKYNLCEKMEFVPFIKKALKRLKDSLAAMKRQLAQETKTINRLKEQDISETIQNALDLSYHKSVEIESSINHYTLFVKNLREICVKNLYSDATYNRRCSSLQILLLVQELLSDEFKDIEWKKEQAEIIFHCLLMDTYEPNKEMAYQLLKTINPTLLHLDSESHVQLIIKVALELGNSIRPIDSITAAYMLKISMLSPIIRNVLCKYCNIDDNVNETITLHLVLLLYGKLQETLVLAKENIGMAIVKCSLYGYLFCIKSLLLGCNLRNTGTDKLWQNTIGSIISLCFELNHTVSIVVNNSSPEGHLPMDLKTLSFNDDVSFPEKEIITPQMVLLCSWRTVKEVSQLFGLLATKASIKNCEPAGGLLTQEQIEHIMRHLVSLLCETKHRGAFEQAYVGFHQLCTRLWRLTNTTLSTLPIHCLHDILIGITGLMPGYSKLCATRRSAGVPFMIQAVLSSESKIYDTSKSAFHSVMKILLQFSELENTINLSQKVKSIMYENTIFSEYEHVMDSIIENERECHSEEINVCEIKTHSMNILRALFRHSQLRDIVKNYIADGLIVAFKNYDNRIWAERNAATLLFSALIVRIFGVQRTKDHINLTTDNKMTGRIFFERYPSLLPFILDELQFFVSTNDTMIKSNVYAILLLLSRLYINYHVDETDINWKINKFVNLVSQCAKSSVYKTRELAARALVPLLTENTAYSIVKKLFSVSSAARDTRISANLLHGYLLQILEILARLPSIDMQRLKSDITNFLSATDWILKGLEKTADGFSCFSIATVYVDILQELYNLDKDIIENCNIEGILHILQQHLIETDLLKQEPGEQMYKISVIKFVLCVGKYSNILQIKLNGQSKAFHIYSQLLITPEIQIQSIAWTTISDVLKREHCQQQRKLLNTYAIRTAADLSENLFKYNPELQDAIFDFLYNSLVDTNNCFIAEKREICSLVMKKIHSRDASNIYSQRVNYLRLLGKCTATLIHELKDEELNVELKEDVYRKVCDSNSIGSSCNNFRSSMFDILHDLFTVDVDLDHYHPMLDWWTIMLQLLIDDNADIRREASKLICRIKPRNELECIESTLSAFFRKFNETVANKYPEVAISALFCWSISLLGETDYEMDETDVFNKCRNYDVFEPVQISTLCFDLTKSILQRYSIDSVLPPDVVRWINYRLDTDFSAVSLKDIVQNYKSNVPVIERKLDEIIDPTYKDKLLQHLAFEKYVSLL